ncbi:GNAT family N-acetyltransferase [Aliikangiella coralliicola]|uniref:GNAT family N-acetyltransferase n=1 Tax=Aliikangiella coralliicola TaxID=2592383 RepID=A0A545UF53_9GAMM|nr:GNAT family N-acetyltransferase [Aliikangiella coralliicola]TQV88094.1 GNAT family N-acetyltransferase [Aliikangiella coralliicola]
MKYHLEYPELANALYFALKQDAFYQTMEASVVGDKAARKSAMLGYMDFSILEAQKYGECFVPEKQNYGVSIWGKPLQPEELATKHRLKKNFITQHMGSRSFEVYQNICQFMSSKSAELIADNAWYLSIIGILPEFQGQGLGPGLIESVLNKTDALGVSTYLETFTSRNKAFYFRLGYEVVGNFTEPNTEAEYWLLQRQPVSLSES